MYLSVGEPRIYHNHTLFFVFDSLHRCIYFIRLVRDILVLLLAVPKTAKRNRSAPGPADGIRKKYKNIQRPILLAVVLPTKPSFNSFDEEILP